MSIYKFHAQALTPIHVGSGQEIEPTEFTIHGKRLLHFNPTQVLNSLKPEESNRFIQLLEKADLKAIQSFLRTHVDPQRHGIEQVDASQAFLNEFAVKAANPSSQFRVFMMPRNHHSGQVYLPGSSLKGAIRTAVVNYFANMNVSTRQAVHEAVSNADRSRKARILEESALNRSQHQTERDVFRLVDVEDISLSSGSTRIDRVIHINPRKQGSERIQIWVERLKARSDVGSRAPSFSITLHIDTRAMQHELVRSRMGRSIDIGTIFEACNHFYWKRMESECEKFDGKSAQGAGWKAISCLFPRGRKPDGEIVTIDPSTPYWCMEQRKRMLLRVGRFSHFESLSVDELRQGHNVQARKPITDMGSTRSRCVMEEGTPPMPFGWLLLTLDM